MTISDQQAYAARLTLPVKPEIPMMFLREHLPCVPPECMDEFTQEQWNTIMEFLAKAAEKQPFGDPYFWAQHEKNSFVKWLRSWKV